MTDEYRAGSVGRGVTSVQSGARPVGRPVRRPPRVPAPPDGPSRPGPRPSRPGAPLRGGNNADVAGGTAPRAGMRVFPRQSGGRGVAYLLAIIAGALNMMQGGANATLNERLNAGPVVPALVAYAGGVASMLVLAPFLGRPPADLPRAAAACRGGAGPAGCRGPSTSSSPLSMPRRWGRGPTRR